MGREGGGMAQDGGIGWRRMIPEKQCYINAVNFSSSCSAASAPWMNLGRLGGGTCKGESMSSKDCFVKAVSLDSENPIAWSFLAVELGRNGVAIIGNKPYSCIDCWAKAGELGLSSAVWHLHRHENETSDKAWHNVFEESWVAIQQMTSTSRTMNYALPDDLRDPIYLIARGMHGGVWYGDHQLEHGRGRLDSEKCYKRALAIDPNLSAAWHCLAAFTRDHKSIHDTCSALWYLMKGLEVEHRTRTSKLLIVSRMIK